MVDLDTANVQISVSCSHQGRNDATILSVLSRINDLNIQTGPVTLVEYFSSIFCVTGFVEHVISDEDQV